MLADLNDLDRFVRIRVEVHHVAGFLGRLRAGVHRDTGATATGIGSPLISTAAWAVSA